MTTLPKEDGSLPLLRRFAALSGPFNPLAAIMASGLTAAEDIAMAASQLATACDIAPPGAEDRWLMRMPERRYALTTLRRSEELAAAIAWRQHIDTDEETADLLAVLMDQPPLDRLRIEAVIDGGEDRALLQRIVVALDRAGEAAPACELLTLARSALAEHDRGERRRLIAERGFFGRQAETDKITSWIDRPTEPVTQCLQIVGVPGIGKSALLEDVVARFLADPLRLVVRLDFDRAGLNVIDLRGLTMEAARQLGEGLGAEGRELLDARIEAAAVSEGLALEGAKATEIPGGLVQAMGKAVGRRPILFVLDTLEVLRGRGESHPGSLFNWIDVLQRVGHLNLRALAASRGDGLDACPERVGDRIDLTGLDDDAARALLKKLGVPPAVADDVLALADGHPLKLRLAGEIAIKFGLDELPKRKTREAVSAAFLYRFLLSRIDDPQLRKLAHPGLVVRRINAAIIREVLAPVLKLRAIDNARAQSLMEELASHHWLLEPDTGAPGFYKHRADMRVLLLPLLYQSEPGKCAAIDKAAAIWFGRDQAPWRQAEALYHRLQLMRRPSEAASPPSFDPQITAFLDADAIAELPQAAREHVQRLSGQRGARFRGEALGDVGDDVGLLEEISRAVERQDWAEGQYLVDRAIEAKTLDPRSRTADAIRTFLWRTGRWDTARRWLHDRDLLAEGDDDIASMAPADALTRLEMRAEFAPRQLVADRELVRANLGPLQKAAIATPDNIARNGAMAFLLRRYPRYWPFVGGQSRDLDLATIAIQAWEDGSGSLELETVLDLGRGRANAILVDAPRPRGQLLGVSTPYAAPLRNLRLHSRQQADGPQVRLGQMFDSDLVGPFRPQGRPDDDVTTFTESGLLAEWAGAVALQARNRNIVLIARAAERWRRTMAGDWTYRPRPRDWPRERTGAGALWDETVRARIISLFESHDPVAASHREIRAWLIDDPKTGGPSDDAGGFMTRLFRRAGLTEPNPSRRPNRKLAEQRAVDLLRRRMPAAFVPPLAVLLSTHPHREERTNVRGTA